MPLQKGAKPGSKGFGANIKTEIGAHVQDIEFTANVLGNSGGSEDQSIQTGGSGASTEPSQTSDAEKPHG